MSTIGWIILLVLVVPMIGLLIWALLRSSFVRVPSGSLGLVMIRGKATDRALPPGAHFVAALRRHMIEEYPSVQLTYRADGSTDSSALTASGPALQVMLGDNAAVTLTLVVRFRLIPEQLRMFHERYGPNGIFTLVRDDSTKAALALFGEPKVGLAELLGEGRQHTETLLTGTIGAALLESGIEVCAVVLGVADLGWTGPALQAIASAPYELDRENAEAETRRTRALNDVVLGDFVTGQTDAAWRYRFPDLWRDLAQRANNVNISLPADSGRPAAGPRLTDVQSQQPGTDGQPQLADSAAPVELDQSAGPQ